MAVAVQGELVSTVVDIPNQVRVGLGTPPDQMEGGVHPVLFQDIEQARCIPRVWTIVKGQCKRTPRIITLIKNVRITVLCGAIVSL